MFWSGTPLRTFSLKRHIQRYLIYFVTWKGRKPMRDRQTDRQTNRRRKIFNRYFLSCFHSKTILLNTKLELIFIKKFHLWNLKSFFRVKIFLNCRNFLTTIFLVKFLFWCKYAISFKNNRHRHIMGYFEYWERCFSCA